MKKPVSNVVRLLLCILLSATGTSSFSQPAPNVVATLFPLKQQVNDICKDKKGLLWLATQDGLYIYDGQDAINVSPRVNIAVRQIRYDRGGNKIWGVTAKELFLIDCTTFSVRLFKLPPDRKRFIKIETDPIDGRLLCFSEDGILYHASETGRFETIANTGKAPRKMTVLKDGTVYFTDSAGLYRYVIDSKQRSLVKTGINPPIYSGLWARGDTLLIGTWYVGLSMFDGGLRNITPPYLQTINDTNGHLSLAIYHGQILFFGFGNNAFYMADLARGTCRNLTQSFAKVFSGASYNCYLSDGDETIWIGSNNGLIKISLQKQLFKNVLSDQTPPISTRAILKSGNGLYVASYSGIFHKEGDGPWEHINKRFTGDDRFITPYAMLEAGHYIYLAGETDYFQRYDKRDHTVSHSFYTSPGKQGLGEAYCFAQQSDGKIWIGTKKGFAMYDTTSRILSFEVNDRYDVGGIQVKGIYCDDTLLLAATPQGLFIFNRITGQKKRIWSETYPLMTNNDVHFVRPDGKGNLLVASKGGGVYIYSIPKDSLSNLSKKDGLSDDIVYSILPDNRSGIWVSTHRGLSHYDFSTRKFNNYFEEDGLSNNEFNHSSYLRDEQGYFYFGGVNGINIFHPDSIRTTTEDYSVFVSGVKKWEANGNEGIHPARGLYFVKDASDLSMGIMLGVSSHAGEGGPAYWYQVKGITTQWQEIRSSNILRLDGLPYGTYKVAIRALNDRGRFSSNTLNIIVDLQSPFYYKWWFILLLLLTMSLATYGAFRYKLRQLQKYQQLRVQIASDMHDEVGSFLTSIGMYSDNLMSNKNYTGALQQKISKIANLSREATVSMRDIVWAIDARNDVSENLVEHIRNHAEEMLLPKNINLHFNFDTLHMQMEGNDRQHLYFIVKEAINNIAKHSKAENVYIDLTMRHRHFALTIRNNGALAENDQARGQGLRNMKLRSEKIGASFSHEVKDGLFSISVNRG